MASLIALLLLAPVWVWLAVRLVDPSDDPYGVLALLAYGVFAARQPARKVERIGAIVPLILTTYMPLPGLVKAAAAVAVLGLVVPRKLHIGHYVLLALAVPWVSTVSYLFGYPFRCLVGELVELSLRAAGLSVQAHGTSLQWGATVLHLDAPCSGVHLLWASLFIAGCLICLLEPLSRSLLAAGLMLPGTVLAAVAANVCRISALFWHSAGVPIHVDHDVAGALSFGVAAFSLVAMARGLTGLKAAPGPAYRIPPWSVWMACAAVCMLFHSRPHPILHGVSPQFPTHLEGRPLQPVPLTDIEKRFAQDFPGHIGRFTDGSRIVVLRWVEQPTRKLHPAVDCWKGMGAGIDYRPAWRDSQGALWSCFVADGRVHVRERIVDLTGRGYSDFSEWYWAAWWQQEPGPWLATTVVE